MAGTKIKLKDQLGRVVRVGGGANGATVGKDLRWPDGSLVKVSDIRNPSTDTGSTSGMAATVWKLIREVPANIQKLAKLAGAGFTTRGPDGEWYQRSIEAGEGIDVVDGDGVAGNPTIGLADLPDAGGGALLKIVRDAKGRVSGTSDPTTDDLPEGAVNLYFTDERAAAAAPVQSVNGKTVDVVLAASDVGAIAVTGTTNLSSSVNIYGQLSNDSIITISGGGSGSSTTGANMQFAGTSHPTAPGRMRISSGTGADVEIGLPTGQALRPTTDNSRSLGAAANRWSVVYAGTGTINTSDAREKTPVHPLTAAEIAAAIELGNEIGVYQWLAMIADKGEAGARLHIGMTVQRAISIMESHGLDPMRYGFICYDEWPEQPEVIEERRLGRCVLSEDPEVTIYEGVEESMADSADVDPPLLWIYERTEQVVSQEYRPAGDRYSFRMDELLAFIARGFAHRLTSIEQRLAAAGL